MKSPKQVACSLAIAANFPFATSQCQSIAEIACSLDDFSTLCTAVTEAGLGDALSGGTWTVFAPTNAAFAELGDLLDTVLADEALLTDILLFHAVDKKEIKEKDLHCTELTKMANGEDSRTVCRGSRVYQKGVGNPRNDMPEITSADIDACNGVIHVVNEVMLPPSTVSDPPEGCSSIAEIACSLDYFSTLCTAVTAAGLADALNGGKWTVFAPTNAAFAELGDTLDAVFSDPDLLTDILLFHAVGEKELKAKDLRCKKTTEMANGKDSRTVCRRGDIYQKGAGNPRSDMPKIVDTDIDACNGVIHVVDEVLLP